MSSCNQAYQSSSEILLPSPDSQSPYGWGVYRAGVTRSHTRPSHVRLEPLKGPARCS